MREYIGNNAETDLDGALNDSDTTFAVTDASVFPAVEHRLLVDSEIMLVTGVSSDTVTVTRGEEGTTAASHSSGAAATAVGTLGGLERYTIDDVIWGDGYPYRLLDASGNDVDASDFTAINAGSATITDDNGGIRFSKPQAGGLDDTYWVKSRPSGTVVRVTACMMATFGPGGDAGWGILIRNSSNENARLMRMVYTTSNGYDIRSVQRDDATTSGGADSVNRGWFGAQKIWIQFDLSANDNIEYRTSFDGKNFSLRQSTTGFVGLVDQIGFYASGVGSGTVIGHLLAWHEESDP